MFRETKCKYFNSINRHGFNSYAGFYYALGKEKHMRYVSRETAHGTEYWDTEAKRTVFVPKGQVPGFEITANPYTPETRNEELDDDQQEEETSQIATMSIQAMKDYAAEHELEIPKDITKHDDIAEWLNANG